MLLRSRIRDLVDAAGLSCRLFSNVTSNVRKSRFTSAIRTHRRTSSPHSCPVLIFFLIGDLFAVRVDFLVRRDFWCCIVFFLFVVSLLCCFFLLLFPDWWGERFSGGELPPQAVRGTYLEKEPPKKTTNRKPREDVTRRNPQTKKVSNPVYVASKSTANLGPKAHPPGQLKASRSIPDFAAPNNKATSSQFQKHDTKLTNSKPHLAKPHKQPVATTSVNHNNNVVDVEKPKHTSVSAIEDTDVVILRKVQGTNKNEQSGDDLSRSSSITNLNAESKNKGALSKVKKSASKDRLDKIADKKNDKKGLTRNNNKIDDPSYSTESLQEIESLQRQLREMADEKTSLALQLGEQKGQMHVMENEMLNLKKLHEQLNQENSVLRSRLKDVAHSPLSDNEKQQLLLESHRHHSSAPASIATNLIDDGAGGDITACPTPDWDKHSSSNVSEISVACLQDKINQMEETHYSTKEELQATVQELNDLQRQLTELQQDNYQLLEDKNLMFDSLCRQTERLNESKAEIENLKQRLRDKDDDTGQFESVVEREQKLMELLKSTQEEREVFLLKQEQLSNELQEAINNNTQQASVIEQLNERVKTLESTLDAKHAEHRQLDQELTLFKDQSSGMQIEINRLTDLLETARTKIVELEQDRALSDKSELDELLDNARKEKDALESEVTHLKEQVARSKNESEKLKDQVSILQEECKVTRNNAKCTQSELEYKCENLVADKNNLNEQLQQLQEAANGLQVQAQCQLEDKRQLSSVLSETQKLLSEAERRNMELESELADLKKLRKEENEEWEKFQNDLLTSVRVANDFKTEAQQDLQKMIMENKAHREKVRHLEAQIDKLKVNSNENITLKTNNNVPTEDVSTRRQKVTLNRQNSRQSVKSLIESIENAGKPVKSGLCNISRSSSNSSINSLTSSDARAPSSPPIMPSSPLTPTSPVKSSDWNDSAPAKTPLREQQPNKQTKDWNKSVIIGDDLKNNINNKSEDVLRDQVFQTKTIDYSRRNSYSDLSERKDPLNSLVKNGGSKRNALLKWCQNKTVGYRNIDITNFSSSWNDGLALCALMHTYLPDRIPYDSLTPHEKRKNFALAFAAAESVSIDTTLNINDMVQLERPDWQQVMSYVTAIYKHFET